MQSKFLIVNNVKRPLEKGEMFLVPCIVREEGTLIFVTPVIDHPHNDKENGQKEVHYHVDYRFVKCKHTGFGTMPYTVRNHSKHIFVENYRPEKTGNTKIEYIILPVVNEHFDGITPRRFISKSTLKHKCIHKGKCPHRGYDLSQVKPANNKIICPLHGLEFNSETKQLIENE
jgi:hypothetical protein